ncbi:MAG: hypothetical protein ABMA25_25085, partial [Ilumatobacteraceae bacterium]
VPHAGLDALERGTLVHNVLAKVWGRLRTSDALLAMGSDELDALLDSAADAGRSGKSSVGRHEWAREAFGKRNVGGVVWGHVRP